MIRITAGEFRGRMIKTPKGMDVRPSGARLREAFFNILREVIPGCVFYDLFAGSGAMGLEALSRGAERAVLVESARPSLECIRANVALLRCEGRAEARAAKLPEFLRSAVFHPELPAVFFLDPPFRKGMAEECLLALAEACARYPLAGWRDSLVVAQAEKEAALQDQYGPWKLGRQSAYGESALWFYEFEPAGE